TSCPGLKVYSDQTGLTYQQLSSAVDARQLNPPPACTTCEGDSPLGGTPAASAVQGKFTCLQTNHSKLASNATADQKVVEKMKLLLEFQGHQLLAEQRSASEALYSTYPSWTPA